MSRDLGRDLIDTRQTFARGRWVWLLLVLGSFLQQPGATTFDTKFDLTQDPAGLLGGALHLWNPTTSLGGLQNQIYGYLFPQGTWFLVLDAMTVPDWVAQRLWSAVLLVLAYEGCRYLARAFGLPTYAGVLVGLAYALSPRLLGASGVITGEATPISMLPWSVLPLVLATRGRLDPRAAGLLSGVAVLFMGGVNAVGTLAVVPAGLCVVLAHLRHSGGRRLAAWWAAGLVLATAWWMVPLLVLGKYSPPFLDFIETAAATTSSTGWANSVRGADHWVAYSEVNGRAWWPGSHMLVTEPTLIIVGALIGALGVFGLTHRRMPMRGTLLAVFLIGMVCLVAGNAAAGGSLVDGAIRTLLDGALAPLRNVHKVDPLVRLPLALGLGHSAVLIAHWMRQRTARSSVPVGVRSVSVAALAMLVVSGGPLLTGDLRTPGWQEVPKAWTQAGAYLERSPDTRALVMPGSGFALQTWGWTIDEPLQAVADVDWVTRSQVPMVAGPTARVLDDIERRLSTGRGSDQVAAMLGRMGITHVVLRRDLDPAVSDAVRPQQVEATLETSPRIRRVASYGSTPFGEALITIYRVEGASSRPQLVDRDEVGHLDGAPEDVFAAMETGLLGNEPVVVGPTGSGIVSDGQRRVERQFGRTSDAVSQTMTLDEEPRSGRVQSDYPGVVGSQDVTAEYVSEVTVSATSSQGYPDVLGAVRPDEGPAAAFDGRRQTAWRSAWLTRPVGQGLDFELGEPVRAGAVLVRFDVSSGASRVTRARVHVGDHEQVMTVPADGVLTIPVSAPAREIAIRVARVAAGEPSTGRVGVIEVQIPGVVPGRTFVMPRAIQPGADLLMHARPPVRPCYRTSNGPRCDVNRVRQPEDHGALDRTFTTRTAQEWQLRGSVVAAAGPGSAALLQPLGRDTVAAVADSVLGGDPSVSAVFAVDGRSETHWLAEPGADEAEFTLTWKGTRTLDRLQIDPPEGAVRPSRAVITSERGTRTVDLSGYGAFAPLKAKGGVTIALERGDSSTEERPMGAREISLDGLATVRHVPDPQWRTGALCGLGPLVWIDGLSYTTAVRGTVRDLLAGTSMEWEVCGRDSVALPAGEHRIRVDPTMQFVPVSLGWTNVTSRPAPQADEDERLMRVLDWGEAERRLRVGPGEESVLRIPENQNPGWQATLDGVRLEKLVIDGWQQGYVVPAGQGGTLELTFGPDRIYRAGLLVGLGLALLLILGAALATWRRTPVILGVDGGERAGPGGPRFGGLVPWGVGAVLFVAGGPFSVLGWALGRWGPGVFLQRVVGALSIALSGLVIVVLGRSGSASPGLIPDALAALGVGMLVGSVSRSDRAMESVHAASRGRRWLRRRRLSWDWLTAAALCLVAVQVAVRTVVASGSYFRHDDFLHLSLIQELGLGRDYLVRDHGGHVEVGQYLLIWLLGKDATTSFAVAAASLVILQLVASLLLWWLLRLVFPRSWWLLVPFAVYLFTPLGLVATTWWAAGIQAYPLQICMLLTLIGWVHLRRGGPHRWMWGVISLLAHGMGLFFWEKAALVLPALVAFDVLVLSVGTSPRERLRALRSVRGWLIAHGTVLAAYVLVYLAVVGGGGAAGGGSGAEFTRGLWSTIDQTVLRTLLPGLLGAPWSTMGSASTIYPETPLVMVVPILVLAFILLVFSLWLRGSAALGGWILLLGYVAADVALLVVGRADFLFLLVRDPRYITDALPVIVIGLCAAFAAPRGAPTSVRRSHRHLQGPVLAVVCTMIISASTLTTTHLLAPEVQHRESRAYVENLVAQVDDQPHASLVALSIPNEVTVSTDLGGLLQAVGRPGGAGQPAREMLIVDEEGNLAPVVLLDHEELSTRADGDCGWDASARPTTVATLSPPSSAQRVAYFEYLSGLETTLHLSLGQSVQSLAVPPGVGRIWFVLPPSQGELRVWTSEQDRALCLTQAIVGTPWPRG